MSELQRLSFELPTLEGAAPNPHKLVCWQWGDPENRNVLLCVHGLTRNGRDFDFLAQLLSERYRVLCPDMPGRGESGWLTPATAYHNGQYVSDIGHLLNRLAITQVDWIGTSMGGIIGMIMAGLQPSLVRRMVLNDVGSLIPKASLERLRSYVGKIMRFASEAEAQAKMRLLFAPWGIREEVHWQHLMQHSARMLADGSVELTYDPAIVQVFLEQPEIKDADLSHVWNAVTCPVLLLRGADSDLLLHETAVQMAASRDGVKLVEIAGCGHAPHLMSHEQISMIGEWLR